MKIEVIMPVIQYELAMPLLEQINANTRPPERVIIIDNICKTHVWYPFENFIMEFYFTETKKVNESWELGRSLISPDCDYVTFLNDDLIIGSWFFQRVIETFESRESFGVVIPNTVDRIDKVKKGRVDIKSREEERMDRPNMREFEGWAFTIRKEILDTVPPIPYDRISTFHGDDWIWEHIKRMGYSLGKDLGNNIYHYVGQSINKLGFRDIKKSEHNEWVKIREELWG